MMKDLGHSLRLGQPVGAADHRSAQQNISGTPLLRLPVEIRWEIYRHCVKDSRSPHPNNVHENVLSAVWKDSPSPLLCVNRQIRAEVSEILKNSPFTMRVTREDLTFDSQALSCFIIQNRPKEYAKIPHLAVEIWPPHPDRPIDVYHIYKDLQQLRNDLRNVPQIGRLDLIFLEDNLADWSSVNEYQHFLRPQHYLSNTNVPPVDGWSPYDNDIVTLTDIFALLGNVSKACIRLPQSLRQNEHMVFCAEDTEELMMGRSRTEEEEVVDRNLKRLEEGVDESGVWRFKYATAQIARHKLDEITNYGQYKMTHADYHDFIKIWPHFEALELWDVKGKFEGWDHYAEEPTWWSSSFGVPRELDTHHPGFQRCDCKWMWEATVLGSYSEETLKSGIVRV